MNGSLQILPVTGIGRIEPGDDLVAIIGEAAPWLQDGDVVVVTSKIVSKAEGRLVEVPAEGPEREAAREAALQAETARVVARRGATRIVATHHGFVMAAAGIDASNVDRHRLVLLPKDPDASARAIRAGLAERYGRTVAVIISDTMGRPWRLGLTDAALGVAGLAPLRDHRGQVDPYGKRAAAHDHGRGGRARRRRGPRQGQARRGAGRGRAGLLRRGAHRRARRRRTRSGGARPGLGQRPVLPGDGGGAGGRDGRGGPAPPLCPVPGRGAQRGPARGRAAGSPSCLPTPWPTCRWHRPLWCASW